MEGLRVTAPCRTCVRSLERITAGLPSRLSLAGVALDLLVSNRDNVAMRKIVETISDDLDGSANASAVPFSYDGVDYTIDLSNKNKTAFDKVMKPYVAAASKVGGRRASRRRSPSSATTRPNLNEVRSWAKTQGMKVSDRGRVSAEVLSAFHAR